MAISPEPEGESSEAAVASADRRAAWWAWPLVLLSPLVLIAMERLVPAAEAEAGAQQDRSLLAVLQFQAKIIIAAETAAGEGEARKQLAQLEAYARDDHTAAALAMVHAFIGSGDESRDAARLVLAKRREAPDADRVFLERAEQAVTHGVGDLEREQWRERIGWFAGLLGAPGDADAAPGESQIRSQSAVLLVMVSLAFFAGFVALLAGAGLLLVTLIRRNQGRMSFAFDPAVRPSGVFLESFALFLLSMALGNVGGLLWHWLLQPGISLAGLVLALIWPRLRGFDWRASRRALGWHRGRGIAREMAAGLVGYLAMLPMAVIGIAMTALLMLLAGLADGGMAAEGSAAAPEPVTHPVVGWMLGGWQAKVFCFVLAAILAPLVEETFFRGAFFRHLRSRLGLFAAGLLNGALFASLHPQGWMAIPALTMMGFGFSCIREWRDSLIAPVTAHAINNGLLVGGLALVLS